MPDQPLQPGDRVVMTEAAIRQGLDGPHCRTAGVVVSISLIAPYIRVRRDGLRGASRWHASLWRKLVPAKE